MLKIIFAILLFIISIILFTILYVYYKLVNQTQIISVVNTPNPVLSFPTQTPSKIPSILRTFTPYPTQPRATTKYPLTEQVIKGLFTAPLGSNYITPYSQTLYDELFISNIKEDIIERFIEENPNKTITFNCYILYTNIFYPSDGTTQQGSVTSVGQGDHVLDQVQESSDDYESEYDIIGSYFFKNFYQYLSENTNYKVYYYDYLKKIVIPRECLIEIYNDIRETDPNNINYLFTQGEMPMDLDVFVPKISRYLYYNYRNNPNTNVKYMSWLEQCLS
jgi:hypothetical protein